MEYSSSYPIHYYVSIEDALTLHSILYNVDGKSMSDIELEKYQRSLLSKRDDRNRLPLHVASEIPACSNIIRLLIQLYPDGASEKDYSGNLPLHYYTSMITNDSILSIKLLFNAYPDAIRETDCNNELPIHDLLRHLDIDEVADMFLLFVSLYPESVQVPDCHNQLPIHAALEKNALLKVIEGLIKLVPSLVTQQTQPYRNLLLHYYLKTGSSVRVDIVKCLMTTNDSQLIQKDYANNLPIHLGLKCGSPEDVVITIIRAYIKYGILSTIIDDKDSDGNNIIMLAIKHGYSINVLKLIFSENRKYKMYGDLEHRNYFYLVAQYQSKANDILELLIQLFPNDVNEQNIEGNNALHAASCNQPSYAFVKTLIEASPCMLKIKSKNGYLPIHCAVSDPEIVPAVIKLIGNSYPNGLLHPTDDADGNLPIHIAVRNGASLDNIRNLLLCNTSAAAVKNNHGQFPIIAAIQSHASLSVIVALLFAYPIKIEEFKGLLTSDDHVHEYDFKILSFVISLLSVRRQVSTVHIHLVGHSQAGKTTFRGELKQTLGKSWVSHQLNSLFKPRNSNATDVSRTIGMQCDIFDNSLTRWIIHDYGGQREFHVNHSKFLSTPGSVYVIVVALYDIVKQCLISEEEIISRYKYWVKYIYSLADETPLCLTLINFKKKSDELDSRFSIIVEQLIRNEQKNWVDSNIKFIGEPVKIDVIDRDEVFNGVNSLLLDAVSRYNHYHNNNCNHHHHYPRLNINKFPVSAIINECLKRKFEWPRAITELQLIHEIIFPFLQQLIVSSEIEESYVDPLCSLLSQFIVHRLEKLGEIIIVEGSNGVNWAITDPNWLTEKVLGKIFYPSNKIQRSPVIRLQDVIPISTELIDERADVKSEFNFIVDHVDYLPALLEAIGVCIPIHNSQLSLLDQQQTDEECVEFKSYESSNPTGMNMWFPSFIDIDSTHTDLLILPNVNRIVVRRFRLSDPSRQIFPPGYFPFLFVNVAGLERQSTNLKFFNDGMELVANYAYELASFTKHRSKLQIIINRSTDYFDVIVAGVKVANGDPYVWRRLEDIRSFIFNPSPSAWQKNVNLDEYCVHPGDMTKEIPFMNTLQGLLNPIMKEEMLSYYYGERDAVAVEELTSSSVYNEKPDVSLGLEEFYRKSTNSFHHLHEAIQSQNAMINKMKGLTSEIQSSMRAMSILVDDSHVKASTIVRDVISLKNGLPDAKRIDDDEVDDIIVDSTSSIVFKTDESPEEIDRIENKAEQIIDVTNNMKSLLRQLERAYDDTNELIMHSSISQQESATNQLVLQNRQLKYNNNDYLIAELSNQLANINSRMNLVSENVERIMFSSNKISATIQSMVARNTDIPALPLIVLDPPKGNDWRNLKKWGFKKSRLFFICPITLKVGAAGIKGKGYKIYEPKDWLISIIPLLKVSIILLQIAVRSMGVSFNIPFPDFVGGNEAYLSNVNNVLDEMMLVTSGDAVGEELNKLMESLDDVNDTKISKELLHETIDENSKVRLTTSTLTTTTINTASIAVSDNMLDINDRVYAAVGQLLRSAGDPMPNNRPIWSGLVGPIISKKDGTVAWIHESAVEDFHLRGREAFYCV